MQFQRSSRCVSKSATRHGYDTTRVAAPSVKPVQIRRKIIHVDLPADSNLTCCRAASASRYASYFWSRFYDTLHACRALCRWMLLCRPGLSHFPARSPHRILQLPTLKLSQTDVRDQCSVVRAVRAHWGLSLIHISEPTRPY